LPLDRIGELRSKPARWFNSHIGAHQAESRSSMKPGHCKNGMISATVAALTAFANLSLDVAHAGDERVYVLYRPSMIGPVKKIPIITFDAEDEDVTLNFRNCADAVDMYEVRFGGDKAWCEEGRFVGGAGTAFKAERAEADNVYAFYMSDETGPRSRIHIATFDAPDSSPHYNFSNCSGWVTIYEEYSGKHAKKFWCEQGRFHTGKSW